MDIMPYTNGIIESSRNNGVDGGAAEAGLWGSVKSALSWAATPILLPLSATNNVGSGLALGAVRAGEGVAQVGTQLGSSIKKTVTSFADGIKWGVAILVLLIVGFYLMPLIPTILASRRSA
jgi:hypothetical protein